MAILRISRSTKHVALFSLGVTLVTLFLTGNHIYKPENHYIYDMNTAYMANITSLNTSHARRAQMFLQKIAKTHGPALALQDAINSRTANKTQLFLQKIAKTHGPALALQDAINSRTANKTKHDFGINIHSGNSNDRLNDVKIELHMRSQVETEKENKEGPKTVVLLAYMHTGSSYTARIIQNHPGTFYEFEPLRSIQESSRQGRIIQYLNGTSRRVSGEVIDAEVGAEAAGDTITCNHQKLDVATLKTVYRGLKAIDNRDTAEYFRCLKKDSFRQMDSSSARNNGLQNINHINSNQDTGKLPTSLNPVNGQNYRRTRFIHRGYKSKVHTNFKHRVPKIRVSHNFQNPFIKENIQSCLPHLIDRCKNATNRLTKYIRMTMEMVEQLFDKVEDLRVIHLLRDPRAMMDSQLRKNDMNVKLFPLFQRRTQYMCARMKMDLDIAKRLKKSYPGQIFTLRYEDLVDDPLKIGQQLFHFIGIPFTSTDKQFIMSTSIEPGKDSKYKASVWRHHIPSKHLLTVNTYCHDLYKQLGYIRFASISDVRNLKVPDHLDKGANVTGVTN